MGRRSSEVSLRKGDQIYNSPLNVTLPCAWADGGLPRCVRGVLLVEGLEEGSLSGLVVVAFGPHGGQIIEIRVREACQEVLPSGDGERTSRVLDLEEQTEAVAVVAAPNVHVEEALGEWYDVNVDLHGGVGGSGLSFTAAMVLIVKSAVFKAFLGRSALGSGTWDVVRPCRRGKKG